MNYLREVLASRDLLLNLTLREVRGQYKRTVFGRLWSLANPLSAMLVYTFVFYFVLRSRPTPGDPSGLDIFAVWLLCALLPWTFFSTVVNTGMASLVANSGLIQKVYFSRIVLPLAYVGSAGVNWLFEMGVLVAILFIVGSFVLPWLPLVIVAMVLLAVFGAGVALALSVANVYFRDTQYFVGILLQIWFYLTPIIYPVQLIGVQSQKLGGLLGTPIMLLDVYRWNPMERFVSVFRQLLYDNRWPDLGDCFFCVVAAVVSFSLGVLIFRRNERRLAEVL